MQRGRGRAASFPQGQRHQCLCAELLDLSRAVPDTAFCSGNEKNNKFTLELMVPAQSGACGCCTLTDTSTVQQDRQPGNLGISPLLTDKRIYRLPVFTEEFCQAFVDELENFEQSDMPKGRPNTMNNYGVGLISCAS